MERSTEVTYHQVQLAIAIPIHCPRTRADILELLVFAFDRDDEGFLVRAGQNRGRFELSFRLAPEHLEQPRHRLLMARVGTGQNIVVTVAVKIHKLWSRAGASPNAGNFCDLPFSLQPFASGKTPVAQAFINPDFSVTKLANKQILFAIAINVSQTRRGVTRSLDADNFPSGFESHRSFKFHRPEHL